MPKGKRKGVQANRKAVARKNRINNKKSNQNRIMRAPVASNRSSRNPANRPVTITGTERITAVTGSADFATTLAVQLNPGLDASFPWVSGIATHYECYRLKRLEYTYKNLVGTSTSGNVLMSFDYDALDTPPASAVEVTQSSAYVDGAPWRILKLQIPTGNKTYFVRNANVSGADLKTYDVGLFSLSTEACSVTTEIGYLEVSYEFEFMKKQPQISKVPTCRALRLGISAATTLTKDDTWRELPFNVPYQNTIGAVPTGPVVAPLWMLPPGCYHVLVQISTEFSTSGVLLGGNYRRDLGLHVGTAGQSLSPEKLVNASIGASTLMYQRNTVYWDGALTNIFDDGMTYSSILTINDEVAAQAEGIHGIYRIPDYPGVTFTAEVPRCQMLIIPM